MDKNKTISLKKEQEVKIVSKFGTLYITDKDNDQNLTCQITNPLWDHIFRIDMINGDIKTLVHRPKKHDTSNAGVAIAAPPQTHHKYWRYCDATRE